MRIRQRFWNFLILGHDFRWLILVLRWNGPRKHSRRQFFHNLAGILDVNAIWHDSNDLFSGAGLRREINAASDPHLSICLFHCQMKISGRWVADLWYLLQALYLFGGIWVSAVSAHRIVSEKMSFDTRPSVATFTMMSHVTQHLYWPISSSPVWVWSRVPHCNVMTASQAGHMGPPSHIRWKW